MDLNRIPVSSKFQPICLGQMRPPGPWASHMRYRAPRVFGRCRPHCRPQRGEGFRTLVPSSLEREGYRAMVLMRPRSARRDLSIEACLASLGPTGVQRLSLASACRMLSQAIGMTRPGKIMATQTTEPKQAAGYPILTYAVELPVPFRDHSPWANTPLRSRVTHWTGQGVTMQSQAIVFLGPVWPYDKLEGQG